MSHRVFLSSLLVAVFVSLPAHAQAGKATACNAQNATCREDCTMDFGTSVRTQSQLYRCIEACQTTHQRCTERWNELREANIDPEPERPRPINDDIFISDEQPVPAPSRAAPPEVTRDEPTPRTDGSGRTRYADPEETAPARAPSMRVEQENYNEGISLPDDDEPGTPSAPSAPSANEEPGSDRTDRSDRTRSERPDRKPEPKKSSSKKKSRPDLPPEPEYDISDWDPNGR